MVLKKLMKYFHPHYLLYVFFALIFFVVAVSLYKTFFKKDKYIYAKVKVGQGLWWVSTPKPPIWFVKALKKGDVERDLVGKPVAQLLSVRYYPWISNTSQYDIYLTLKLKVSENKKTGQYSFNRSTIGIGSPIDLEFPNSQLSGTITQLQKDPFQIRPVFKTVTLEKKWAFPWEYEAIQAGDSYFDGEDKVFEIVDKKQENVYDVYSSIGNNYPIESDLRKHITLRAKIQLSQADNQLIFGEEQIIKPGKPITIATSNFIFQDYLIEAIE